MNILESPPHSIARVAAMVSRSRSGSSSRRARKSRMLGKSRMAFLVVEVHADTLEPVLNRGIVYTLKHSRAYSEFTASSSGPIAGMISCHRV